MKQNKTVLYKRMIDRIVHFYTQIDEYGAMISGSGSIYYDVIAGINTKIDEDINVLVEVFSQASSFKTSVKRYLDCLVFQGFPQNAWEALAVFQVDDFNRSVVDRVGKKQNFEFRAIHVFVDAVFDVNVRSGLYVNVQCFHTFMITPLLRLTILHQVFEVVVK